MEAMAWVHLTCHHQCLNAAEDGVRWGRVEQFQEPLADGK